MVRGARDVRASTVRACIFMYKMALQGSRIVNWIREIRNSGIKKRRAQRVLEQEDAKQDAYVSRQEHGTHV